MQLARRVTVSQFFSKAAGASVLFEYAIQIRYKNTSYMKMA